MSDSSDSSDEEDINTTGLIATRAKRATAGNLYAQLRADLDDPDIQRALLAEDADDVGDYEGSDKDDDEDAFESSSDDEDAGPPQEGDAQEFEGEKELKKVERAEARQKRKVQDARLKIPSFQKKKRVKIAEDVQAGAGAASEEPDRPKPKKKSERANWLPSADDMPVRQSRRSLAVSNREVIHANLKESAARSEKQRRVMKDAAERERGKSMKKADLTQEERMKKCDRVERETARELGRYEREEAERQRAREEALAAKRRKGIIGPVFRYWSGSAVWEGDRVKVKRVEHGSLGEEELMEIGKPKEVAMPDAGQGASALGDGGSGVTTQTQSTPEAVHPTASTSSLAHSSNVPQTAPATGETSTAWLQGIQEYAAQPSQAPSQQNAPAPVDTTSNDSTNNSSSHQLAPAVQPPQSTTQIYHGWPPGSHTFSLPHPATPTQPVVPAPPVVREQAQRTLLILDQFPDLAIPSAPTSTKRKPGPTTATKTTDLTTTTSPLNPTPLSTIILPTSYPSFTPEESRYLITRPRRRGGAAGTPNTGEQPLPPPPAKVLCATTQWPAKFRDPKTGVPYADLHQFKALQRVISGGTAWSGVFGAWIGPNTGKGSLGRAARGVPEGFSYVVSGEGVKKEG